MIETLGNLGDFIGGIGVVVTVIYLAVQVRQSIASTRSATYQSIVSAISDWSREIGADPKLARIMRVGMEDSSQLTEDEYTQYEMLVVSVTRNFENIHYQYLAGGISESAWAGWSVRISTFFQQPGTRSWWEHHHSGYATEFRKFVEKACAEITEPPNVVLNAAPPDKPLETDA